MNKIELNILGKIRTPYKEPKNIPIQGKFKPETTGYIEIGEEYHDCLKGIDQFSHLMLFYYLDRVKEELKIHKPFLEDVDYGSFATRNNRRVNKIGFSIVKFEKIEGKALFFSEVDILDNTPLLDIKPYVKHFDNRDNINSGWYDKHFEDGKTPERTILK